MSSYTRSCKEQRFMWRREKRESEERGRSTAERAMEEFTAEEKGGLSCVEWETANVWIEEGESHANLYFTNLNQHTPCT